MNRLVGRSAVVVGVASAIGRAVALRFASEGADVVVANHRQVIAEDVAGEIRALGRRAAAVACPIEAAAAAAVMAAACDGLEAVDALFLGTTAIDDWPVVDGDIERWHSVFEANLFLPIAVTQALLAPLGRSTAASVTYLTSVDGLRGNPNVPAYSTSKGGLVPWTHLLAQELGPRGIRVNCIATAGIAQTAADGPASLRPFLDRVRALELTPLGRNAVPGDIAGVAAFLASDDAAYVTGAVLPVDGGRTAGTPGTILPPG